MRFHRFSHRFSPALTSPLRRCLAAACMATGLAGCGGGVSIGFGVGGGWENDRSPPSVSLDSPSRSASPGSTVRLVAAAADESGIDSVGFYRVDSGRDVALGSLAGPAYAIDVVVPNDGRSVLSVYARAVDNAGNAANSVLLNITILR